MARPLRIEFPGALCHVTSRGNARQRVFRDDEDREMFLATLPGWWSASSWRCHAYCLMDNHIHSEAEDRFVLLGLNSAIRLLLVCHCYRGEGNVIRIISTRKATAQESRNYP